MLEDFDEYDGSDAFYDEDDDWDDTSDDEPQTAPCPACGTDIYDDAERCPACGEYIVFSAGSVWEGRSVFWVLLGMLGVASTIAALVLW